MVEKKCQLAAITREFARELTFGERIRRRWGQISKRVRTLLPKLLSPAAMAGKTRKVLHLQQFGQVVPVPSNDKQVKVPPLGLQVDEPVRVKTFAQIQQTLDENGCYEGCSFMMNMHEFCGNVYTVARRIDHFFDERDRKLLKARNMVILNGVHCHSEADSSMAWAGCDRACYLFWKEAWLERVDGSSVKNLAEPATEQVGTK